MFHILTAFCSEEKKCIRAGRLSGKSVTIFRTRRFLISFDTSNMLAGFLWFSSTSQEGCCILSRSGYHLFLPELPSSKLPVPATLIIVKKTTVIFALLNTRRKYRLDSFPHSQKYLHFLTAIIQ
jgi:hypothetical protein